MSDGTDTTRGPEPESTKQDAEQDPRGAATRADLLAAAVDLFGRDGYHGTSNRALAQAAGANQALIGYHFGGKRGLYLAVFEHIADAFEARLGPVGDMLQQRLEDPATLGDSDALIELVQTLIERAAGLFASPETATWAMLIVREQQNPSEAFDIVWERIMSRMTSLLCRVLCALGRLPPDHPEVRLMTMTLVGQPLVFRVAREATLRLLGWDDVGAAELEAIRARLRKNVRCLLVDFAASSSLHPENAS